MLTALVFGGAACAEGTSFSSSRANVLCGDCSGDGRLDILDVLRAAQHLMTVETEHPIQIGGRALLACDINGDRRVDMIDVLRINHQVLRSQGAFGSSSEEDTLPCALSAPTVPVAVVGVYYRYSLGEAGVPPGADVSVIGELPPGLSFKPALLEISGVPLGVGQWSFDLEVIVAGSPASGTGSPASPAEGEYADVWVSDPELPVDPMGDTPAGGMGTTRREQLAIDMRAVSVPHPADLEYVREGPDALVVTTLVENTGQNRTLRALAATPQPWREPGSEVALLVAVDDALEAILTLDMPGSPGATYIAPIGRTVQGAPLTGLAFHGDLCLAVDSSGTVYIATREGGTHSIIPIATLTELRGATSLVVQEGRAEPGEPAVGPALIATIADPGGSRQLVRVPLAYFGGALGGTPMGAVELPVQPPFEQGVEQGVVAEQGIVVEEAVQVGEGIQVVHGASGGAVAAAFARSEVDSLPYLYVRRQPDQLALFSFDPTHPVPRFALPTGLLPQVSPLDSMISICDGTCVLLTSTVDPTRQTGGWASGGASAGGEGGLWLLPFDGTYRLTRLIGGFGGQVPGGPAAGGPVAGGGQAAGALARGRATLGTGASVFVSGRGKIYEVFGKRGSQTFQF